MKRLIRCANCAACYVISPAGFTSKESFWCPDLQREVEPDDGCTMGIKGTPGHGCLYPGAIIEGHPAVWGYPEE